jgi:membrane protein
VGSAYGAAGSLAIVLLWVYYSAQILLMGAEFTRVWARRHGAWIQPKANTDSTRTTEGKCAPAPETDLGPRSIAPLPSRIPERARAGVHDRPGE